MSLDIHEAEQRAAKEDLGIEVEHEDEKGVVQYQDDGVTPITIRVTGMLSKRYQASQHVQRGRIMRAWTETPAPAANGEKKPKSAWLVDAVLGSAPLPPDVPEELRELEADGRRSIDAQREAVALCILGWTAGLVDGGAPFECSYKNALRYLRAFPHMQRKLEKAMETHERFFEPASSN